MTDTSYCFLLLFIKLDQFLSLVSFSLTMPRNGRKMKGVMFTSTLSIRSVLSYNIITQNMLYLFVCIL
jgi:hypothetical protein